MTLNTFEGKIENKDIEIFPRDSVYFQTFSYHYLFKSYQRAPEISVKYLLKYQVECLFLSIAD